MTEHSRLLTAINIAENAHHGQVDKSGTDYIQHPLSVMLMGKTEDERIVGVLHDVIEDSDVTYEALLELFGARIANAVKALSRMEGESYMQFIRRIAENQLAANVKIYDLKHNMDTRRISNATSIDHQRTKKYARALKVLEIVVATGAIDTDPLKEVA